MNRPLLLILCSVLGCGLSFGGAGHTPAPAQENAPAESASVAGTGRINDGLVALYGFDPSQGDSVSVRELKNRAATGDSLDVRNEKAAAVEAKHDRLVIKEPTLLRSSGAATKLIPPIKRAGALTVEAWVTPANN